MNFLETFGMTDKTYNRLKYLVQIIFPALTTFVGVLGLTLDWARIDVIITIMTATITMFGASLGLASYNYNKQSDI